MFVGENIQPQGKNSPYDIEINGKKYECKEITDNQQTIRASSKGIAAGIEFRENLNEVMKNIKLLVRKNLNLMKKLQMLKKLLKVFQIINNIQ